jgi:putative membrane protein
VSSSVRTRVGDHAPAVATVLGIVSTALVVAAVRGVLPVGPIPRNETVVDVAPHLNAAISVVAVGTILAGVRAIRRGRVQRHRRLMLSSFALFVTFLVLYLYKVALDGATPFGSDGAVYTFVYLPVLAVHILLAILSLPLLYYVLLLAFTRPTSELPETPHPRVGRVAAGLWLTSFLLGIVVYVLLYLV